MSGPSTAAPVRARYTVRSSDVLEDMRINVFEEGSERVVWYKERFLTDDEILEHVVDNATSTVLWTVHRPKRGWYLRLRTPAFPPGVFIPLLPLPQTSPHYAEAALSFACRTNLPPPPPHATRLTQHASDSDATLTDGDTGGPAASSTSLASAVDPRPTAPQREHSYPPTPPAGPVVVVVNPPSPRAVHAKLSSVSLASPPRALVRAAVTHFVVTPRARAADPSASAGASTGTAGALFSRLVAAIRSNAPTHDYSFTLAPLPGPPSAVGAGVGVGGGAGGGAGGLAPAPLLAFHDQTPVWTARRSEGLLEMDEGQCRVLGVEPAFYVAVALTYLEFLEDRESYLVAAYD